MNSSTIGVSGDAAYRPAPTVYQVCPHCKRLVHGVNPEELANAHWAYVESVLNAHGIDDETIEQCGFHYKTAMVHGFKHGVEYERERMDKERIVDDLK